MTWLAQGSRFVAVGALLVVVDWLVFVGLGVAGVATVTANVAGRVAGAVLGFWANGVATFGQPGAPRLGWRRFARYALVWLLLTGVSTLTMTWLSSTFSLTLAWLAKPLVEAGLAVISFLLARYWVYR